MKEIDKKVIPTKLLWVDLEMTGLDPDNHVIIEVAAEVTDFDFKTLASYEALIMQPEDILSKSNEWAYKQHTESGLYTKLKEEGRPEEQVKHELVGFIKAQFGDEPAILAGNSIHNDRIFIAKWWPEVNELLHYRMLDVTTLKIIMQGKYGYEYKKNDAHRAFDDIQASIAELQDYLSRMNNGS
jgi:oligoribonuclease